MAIEAERHSRCFRCLSTEHTFQLISALVLPLLLGVFTVVITFHQENMAREQWIQDRNESRLQREQELSIANAQRDDLRRDAIDRYADQLLLDYVHSDGGRH